MSAASHPNWYDRLVLPRLTDRVCGAGMVARLRREIVPQARGLVLEIGFGSGLNLEHYDAARVERIVGIEPVVEMQRLARERIANLRVPVELAAVSAERLPYAGGVFDTVLVTYSLCTIPDPVAALREARRVLAPQGRLLFCEHGRAPDEAVRRWQDRLTPLWSRLAGGCHPNRDIPGLIREAGFRTVEIEARYLPGPRAFTYCYWGAAVPA